MAKKFNLMELLNERSKEMEEAGQQEGTEPAAEERTKLLMKSLTASDSGRVGSFSRRNALRVRRRPALA